MRKQNKVNLLVLYVILIFLIIILACACANKTPVKDTGEAKPKPSITPAKSVQTNEGNENDKMIHTNIKLKNAVIAFTFDDGYESDYVLAYPILKKYGIKGTSYIIGSYPDTNTKNALSWAQIKEMAAYGWDFGCHTYMHSNVTLLTADEIKKSMEQENASFEKNGLKKPEIHAYPFGKYNEEAINVIKQYRKQARLAYYRDNFVSFENINPYAIPCVSADMRKPKLLLEKEKLVDKACEQKAMIVFRVHCMYKQKPNDMGKWPVQTDSGLFAQLVEYCVKKGCTFVTMDEFMKMYS